jgi:hypothetical protein
VQPVSRKATVSGELPVLTVCTATRAAAMDVQSASLHEPTRVSPTLAETVGGMVRSH